MTETSETPIAGEILEMNFADNETIVVEVEKDGEIWKEVYEFANAER